MRFSTLHQQLLSLAAATCLSLPAAAAIDEKGQLPLDDLRTFADSKKRTAEWFGQSYSEGVKGNGETLIAGDVIKTDTLLVF